MQERVDRQMNENNKVWNGEFTRTRTCAHRM